MGNREKGTTRKQIKIRFLKRRKFANAFRGEKKRRKRQLRGRENSAGSFGRMEARW